MSLARYNVLLEYDDDDNVWVAYVPTLNWLSTYGANREDALEQTRESIVGYLEAAAKDGLEIPKSDSQAELAAVEITTP